MSSASSNSKCDEKDIKQKDMDRLPSNSSSEYESDEESEEEEEPKLKYERVRGDLTHILDRDSLTCIASDDKV